MLQRSQTLSAESLAARIQSLGAERLIALLVIAFAIVEFYAAMQLSMTEEFTLGPGAMPAIYAAGLLVFATVLLIQPSPKTSAIIETSVADEAETGPVGDYRAGVVTFLLVAVFIASIYFVGFLGGTIIFSLLYVLLVARWPVLQAIVFGVAWGGAVFYGFDHLLGVQLEPGILFGN